MAFLIYLFCLGVGFLFTVLTAFLGHFFGGHDHGTLDGSHGHAEAGADSTDSPGVSAMSPTIIASFITAFGATGVILSEFPATNPPWISAPLSVVGGLLVAGAVLAFLRTLFRKTQSSSESHVATLAGVIANVITPIPEKGVGEISYIQAGTRYTAPARTEDGSSVSNGRVVKITRVVGSQFFVKPD